MRFRSFCHRVPLQFGPSPMYLLDLTRDAASAASVARGIIARFDLRGDCMRSVPAGTAAVVVME
jgi:hypothetical protein